MADPQLQHMPEQLRAALYQNRPEVFNGLQHTLSELLSVARTFGGLQKYDVTQNALNAISRLLAGYLRVRDGDLVMPTSFDAWAGPTDFQFDAVLTEALEGVSSLHKSAIARQDVQLSTQITDALQYLALQSVGRRTLVSPPGENPTTAFVRAYMFGPARDGALRGLDDVALSGARAQSAIGKALLVKDLYLTARGAIDDLEKLAYISIAQRKAHVTGTPVRGIAEILAVAVTEPVVGNHIIQAALLALQRICEAELQFKTAPMDLSLQFALGAFLDLSEPTAIANVEALAVERLSLAIKNGDSEKTSGYRRAFQELNEDLWQHLVAIGTAAAKTESFGLFYVNSNIGEIARHCLWLYDFLNRTKPEAFDQDSAHKWRHEKFADDLLDQLHWIVGATYWRIFDALTAPIKTNLVWDFFPTLSDIGIRALDARAPPVAEAAISSLKSIALKCIEKPIQTPRSAARVAAHIARIGIIAQKQVQPQIVGVATAALKEVDRQFFAKQRELRPDEDSYEAVLLNEIDELKERLNDRSPLVDPEDASFFGRVTAEDIEAFVSRLQ